MALEWMDSTDKEARLYDTSAHPPALVGKWIYSEAENGMDAFHWYDAFHDSYQFPTKLPPDFPNPPGDPPMPVPATSSIWTTKTFWASLGLLLAALVAGGQTVAVDGKVPDFNAIAAAIVAFIAIFQRAGILKAEAAAKG